LKSQLTTGFSLLKFDSSDLNQRQELASRTGLSNNYIYRIFEAKDRIPSLNTAIMIADELGVGLERLCQHLGVLSEGLRND